jgi:uncharacterized RDD family membrane protein YckC
VHPDERVRIDTPEQVALELPIAGIGSRFLAVALDTVLQVALAVVIVLALIYAARMLPDAMPRFFTQLGPAAAILALFCIYWGYFAFFEIIWSGRTPGKRWAHVRVVKESGRAINAYEAIARNVLRAIDFLPVMYGVGVIVMMLNRQSRRVGDYVAGTIVVHDRRAAAAPPPRLPARHVDIPVEKLAPMGADELALIEAYLQRREDLDPLVRDHMREQIATRIVRRTGIQPHVGDSLDDFIEAVARGIRDTGRFR